MSPHRSTKSRYRLRKQTVASALPVDLSISGPLAVAALLLVIIAAVLFSVRPISDSDFWHHIALGRIITEQHRFPTTDELSSTAAGRPWVSSGWLPAIALYRAYKFSPTSGPAAVISIVIALMAAVIFWFGTRRIRSPIFAATLTIAALAACAPRFLPRPDIFSQLMLPLFLLLLFSYDSRPLRPDARSNLRAAAMPILFIIWANLHMLFAIGIALLGLYIALIFWSTRKRPRADIPILIVTFIVSAIACLATPYGWRALWFIWENAQLNHTAERINELKPLWSAIGQPGATVTFTMLAIWAATIIWTYWRSTNLRNVPLWHWIFVAALTALALIQRRQIGLAVPGITMLAFAAWDGNSAAHPIAPFWRKPLALIIPAVLLTGLTAAYISAGILLSPSATIARGGPGIDDYWLPTKAVAFLKKNPPPPKLFHDLYSGGYLAYQLAPTTKVFIDGRLEVYNNGTYDDFFAPPEGRMAIEQLLDKYNVNSALLDWRAAAQQPNHTAAILSQSPQWQLCWFSDHYALFVRNRTDDSENGLAEHAYKYLNPLYPQRFMQALANPVTALKAKAEARRAAKDDPDGHLAHKALEVSGQ